MKDPPTDRPCLPPLLSLLAATLAAILVGACGSGADRDPSTGTKAATTTSAGALPGANRPPVTIGDKNYTEQFVLGELYRQALDAKGFTTIVDRNIGPLAEVTIPALQSGRLDMYPEYLGAWDTTVAGDPRHFRTAHAAYAAGQRYAKAHGLELLHSTPFSDVGAIGVLLGYAQQKGLRTIGDLTKVAPALTLGAPPQYQQAVTGLPELEQVYGVLPAIFKPLDVGDQYQALDQNAVQAANVQTTDGELLSSRYVLLGDPERVFGWGNVVPVVPTKVLAAEGPAFAATINAVSALLSTSTMRQLNAQVDIYHQDPAVVAKQFLYTHGLGPPG